MPDQTKNQPVGSVSSKFLHAVSYTALASIVGRLCGVFIAIILARFLGSFSLGVYAILQSILGLFVALFSFGIGLTASKMMAQHYFNDPKRAGQIIGLLLVLLTVVTSGGIVIYYLVEPVLVALYSIPELLLLLRFSIFWFVLMLLNQLFESTLSGLQGFKPLMVASSVFSVLNLLFVLTALFIGGNTLLNLVIAGTLVTFIQFLVLMMLVGIEIKKHNIYISFTGLSSLFRPVIIDFSAPAFLGKLFEQPLSWLSILLLVKLGSDVSSVGGLTVINNIKTWTLYFPTMLVSVLIPLLTDVYHTREQEVFKKTLALNQRFLWLSTLPVVVLFIAIVRPVLKFFFGMSYEMYWYAGAILLLWTILVPINEVNDRAMIAMGKMWVSLFFRIVYFIIFFIMLFLLVPIYHLTGYVIANGVTYLIYVLIQTMWLVLHLRLSPGFYFPLSSLTILFLLLALLVVNFSPYLVSLILGLLLFVSVALVEWFWIATREEKSIVFECLRKVFRSHEKENAI